MITVESDADATGCPSCGVLAVGHGRRRYQVADAPCFGLPVLIIWLKRVWRCGEPDCSTDTWSETHELIAPVATRRSTYGVGRAVIAVVDY